MHTAIFHELRRAILVLPFFGACASGTEPSKPLTICELSQSSEYLDGRTVRLHAKYVTDLRHGSVLKDEQCPNVSLVPIDPNKEEKDPTWEDFERALYGRYDDLELRVFSVDISGVYQPLAKDAAQGSFTIRQVWSFKRLHGDWKTAK